MVRAGSIKAYAVTSDVRVALAPGIPTFAEIGLPALALSDWYGLFAPEGTPKGIIDKINADVNEALRQPGIQDHLKKLSAEVFGGSVGKTADYMREEIGRWGAVIKSARIEPQ